MKPKIDSTEFGAITVDGQRIEHDILIGLDGAVAKRKKKLSKAAYGTSHVISLAEAEYIYERGAERLIVGSGQDDNVRLSDEAADYFSAHNVEVELAPTPQAIVLWNETRGHVIGVFHVTC